MVGSRKSNLTDKRFRLNKEVFTSDDISIVIPSYNSLKTIERCLDSLLNQDAAPGEIIIVDSSTDPTPDLIRRKYPQVKLQHSDELLFPGTARNHGVKLARKRIIGFIDADCIAAPDWVAEVAKRHSLGYQVVGGAIEVGDPTKLIAWAGHLMEFREFIPFGSFRSVAHIPSCNLSYRKEIFEESGGFPDSYYPQEDLLLNFLLQLEGVKIWFDPALVIKHYCREGFREYLDHQHRIGRVTYCSIKKLSLPISPIIQYRTVASLISPLVGLIKLIRTSYEFSVHYPKTALRHPTIYLLILLGITWWARGFSSGAQGGLSGIRGWDDPNEPIFARISLPKSKTSV